MRLLVPADSLVYLETNDLAAALQPIIDSKPFSEVAKSKPDLSALKGVQLAVAVTGFETSEEKVDDEQVIGRIEPHFVAIADTHAWNFQAVGFAEKKLGSFVENIYGSAPTLEKSDKNGGKYFTWTANDGRKAYALVLDAVIYFGNDETSIEKCLAVRRGETDSIIKTGKAQSASHETLASGYVSTDGIAQIANIVGLQFASESSEDSEVQSAIAGILPQLPRSSFTEISWAATKVEQGFEDKYSISLTPENASVLKETLVPAAHNKSKNTIAFVPAFVPPDAYAVTRYSLQRPQIAWSSLLLAVGKGLGTLDAQILNVFSASLLEPYGISDPEAFLATVDSEIWIVNFDPEGEKSAVVASFDSNEALTKLKSSVDEINFSKPFDTPPGGVAWTSEDNQVEFSLTSARFLILGDPDSVKKCREANFSYLYSTGSPQYRDFYNKFAENNDAIALTYGKDSTEKAIKILGDKQTENPTILTNFTTETRFTKTGIERRTVSDFGLIGSIIAQLGQD